MKWPLNTKGTLLLAAVLILVLALLGWRSGCTAAQRATEERNQAIVTGKQLDKVVTQTADIRAEQQEKEREVEQLDGAGDALPPGFGADLERVRRGRGDQHTR